MVILVVAILRTIPCERRKIKALSRGLVTHCMMSGSPPWTTLELWDFNFSSEPEAKALFVNGDGKAGGSPREGALPSASCRSNSHPNSQPVVREKLAGCLNAFGISAW